MVWFQFGCRCRALFPLGSASAYLASLSRREGGNVWLGCNVLRRSYVDGPTKSNRGLAAPLPQSESQSEHGCRFQSSVSQFSYEQSEQSPGQPGHQSKQSERSKSQNTEKHEERPQELSRQQPLQLQQLFQQQEQQLKQLQQQQYQQLQQLQQQQL